MRVKILSFLLFTVLSLSYLESFSQTSKGSQQLSSYVKGHLGNLGISEVEANNLFITHEYTDAGTGIQHIYAVQKMNGLTITNTSFGLHTLGKKQVDASRLVSLQNYKVGAIRPALASRDAVTSVLKAINLPQSKDLQVKQESQGADMYTIYKRNESSIWDVPSRLVYYNDRKTRSLTTAWEVQMMDVYKRHYWLAYVDATSGAVIEKRDLINHCYFDAYTTDKDVKELANAGQEGNENLQPFAGDDDTDLTGKLPKNHYRVYNIPFESPIDPGAQHVLVGKSGDTLASPDGWHRVDSSLVTYNYARGNNVWAFQDPSPGPLGGVPSADPTRTAYPTNTTAGVPPVLEPFVFDYPINLNNQPQTYQNAAIVNLFYWNNLLHDVFYYLGFTEASGNFEESHTFSNGTRTGGNQGDAVLAQAQDGGGTNNANFLTLTDGTNGQMQMYLWTTAKPDSLVEIVSSSIPGSNPGRKYNAIQGSLNSLPTGQTNLYTNPVINKQLVVVQKNPLSVVGDDDQGCTTGQQSIALPPANDVTGKIAVVRRGNCSFVEKVLSAQQGGAVGVIIVNNVDGPPMPFGGSDASGNAINIPAVMISKSSGDPLIARLKGGATIFGSLKRNSPPEPNRDGDIDNGVISHEYGHGISNRLTGGPMSTLPLGGDEQGGEGWSDYIAMYMTLRTNDLKPATTDHPNGVLPTRSIGNYVTYQKYNGRGIREFPYSTSLTENPATFGFVKRSDYSETHSVGFVWCSILYEVLQSFIDQYGMNNNVYEGSNPTASHNPPASAKGNNIAMRLVIEGMKLQPTSPTFVEERDAILKADSLLYNGQHACMIWKAFAKRGLGYSAVSGSNALGDEVESFDVPLSCDANQKRVRIAKRGPIKMDNNSKIFYDITVSNRYNSNLYNVIVTDTLPAGLTYVKSYPAATVSGNILSWTFNFLPNATKTIRVSATVNVSTPSHLNFGTTHDGATQQFTPANGGGLDTWTLKSDSTQAYSGANYWFAPDTDLGGANTTLTSNSTIAVSANTELVFIHKFASEATYDGGVVEVSENGVQWTYLPPNKFVQNGYTNVIPTANTPTVGSADLAAFSGASPGYIVSIAKLNDYAGKNIYVRFRFVSDPTGGSVDGGGWWLDDVYAITDRVSLTNTASAVTTPGARYVIDEGTNAYSSTTAFVMSTDSTARGSEMYSRTAPITTERALKAAIYPNPTDNVANIDVTNPRGGDVMVTLFDVSGRRLGTFRVSGTERKTVALPVAQLRPGTYWVQLDTEAEHTTLQFIKK